MQISVLGTFQPKGGMYSVILGMKTLAESMGVTIKTDQNVGEIVVEKNKVKGIVSNGTFHATDTLLSGADYHHTERYCQKTTDNTLRPIGKKEPLLPPLYCFT